MKKRTGKILALLLSLTMMAGVMAGCGSEKTDGSADSTIPQTPCTNIFKRGYYVELIAVLKYNSVLILMLSFFLYVSKMSEDFSRLVFVYFFAYNILLTYLGHLLIKKYFTSVYRVSSSSNKVFVITTSDYADDILGRMLNSSEWT